MQYSFKYLCRCPVMGKIGFFYFGQIILKLFLLEIKVLLCCVDEFTVVILWEENVVSCKVSALQHLEF